MVKIKKCSECNKIIPPSRFGRGPKPKTCSPECYLLRQKRRIKERKSNQSHLSRESGEVRSVANLPTPLSLKNKLSEVGA